MKIEDCKERLKNAKYLGQEILTLYLERFIGYKAEQNIRPAELEGLEIDIYFRELGLAFEFQGGQHYVPLYGHQNLLKQKRNDRRKKQLCRDLNVNLVSIDAWQLYSEFIKKELKKLRGKLEKQSFNFRYANENHMTCNILSFLDSEGRKYKQFLRDMKCVTVMKKTTKKRKKLVTERTEARQLAS